MCGMHQGMRLMKGEERLETLGQLEESKLARLEAQPRPEDVSPLEARVRAAEPHPVQRRQQRRQPLAPRT